MASDFTSLGLDPALCAAVQAAFSIEKPSDIQEKVITTALGLETPRDILIRSRTGSGKTLAFLLPILHRLLLEHRQSGRTREAARMMGTQLLVVVPTRELAAQSHQTLERLLAKLHGADHWLVSGTLSGGDRRKSEKERLRKGVHIVVGTPGRLVDHLNNTERWAKQISACRWVVFDEADRLLDSGFEKFVKEILGALGKGRIDRLQVCLCSATVDGKRQDLFGYKLTDPLLVSEGPLRLKAADTKTLITNDFNTQLEHFYIVSPTKMRLAALLGFLEESFSNATPQKIVLFTICCDTVDFISLLFNDPTFKMLPKDVNKFKLHGSLEHKTRIETFNAFTKETRNCLLVCTDVAARGLNLSHVSCIVQYDAPCDMNDYIHRAGRTARQEETGKSVLFLMPSERDYIPELEKKNLKLKKLRWEPLVERVATKVDIKSAEKVTVEETIPEEDLTTVNLDTRKRIFAWLEQLQGKIKTKGQLFSLAKSAYLSFIRAYATHPTVEKSIFHIKKLHLGHIAATFLLDEAPKAVAANRGKEVPEGKPKRDEKDFKGGKGGKGSKGDKGGNSKGPFKPKRVISEFDAGDIDAVFTRKLKRPK
ncbi:Dbp7p [Paramicrosporidium saccamoebae]|uniref:ATP-dependent RNA helicase n=1 Tax=Paramicrosporidium saccamoebae TaxID=1246581 RepID=A0A2H9TPZ3_9FUNG|nr:Dbp7p [Paramicrosporidium saccamoebae]